MYLIDFEENVSSAHIMTFLPWGFWIFERLPSRRLNAIVKELFIASSIIFSNNLVEKVATDSEVHHG